MKTGISTAALTIAAISLATIGAARPDPKGAAGLDMAAIRDAMQFFYLDYSQITTIENLDDTLSTTTNPAYQAANDNGGALVVDVGDSNLRRRFLTAGPGIPGPPYLNIIDGVEGPDGDYDEGTPLDPWGNPYYLYSPLGLIEPKSESISQRYYGDAFDSYAVVSHGADGQPGGMDDLILELPFYISRPVLSRATLTEGTGKGLMDYRLTVRGYILGTNTGSAGILIAGSDSDAGIVEWSPTEIHATLSSFPPEGAAISVRLSSGAVIGPVPLAIEPQTLSVEDWALYR